MDLDQLKDRRILVTGGRGFIGAHLCRRAAEMGGEVISVNRGVHANPPPGVEGVQADLVDEGVTAQLFERYQPDVLLHLASHVYGHRTPEMVLPTFNSNLVSTVNLLAAAQSSGCRRVVLTGSLEEPDLDGTAIPSSPYAASKFAASAYGRMYEALFDMEVANLRVFMVYGPGQADEKKLVPYTIRALLSGEVPEYSSGARLVDWIYVEDVVNAYLKASVAPDVAGHTFEIGTGTLTSVRGVVEQIFQLMAPDQQPSFGGMADRVLEQVRAADTTSAKEILGWQPEFDLARGLDATIQWMRSH